MLAGTKGGAQLDPLRIHTEQNGMVFDMTPGSSSMPDGYTGAGANPFWGETAHFVSVIRGEEELVATPEHGIQIMEMLDAVYTSSDTGKEVQL